MHGAVGSDVERFVEQLPHHRHVALADLQDVTIWGCHGSVDTGGKEHATAPGVWRQPDATCRGQRGNTAYFGKSSRPGNVWLSNVEGMVVEQILEVETGELAL